MEPVSSVAGSAFASPARPEPTTLEAVRIAELVGRGELSAEEVTRAHLAHIADVDPQLNALVEVDAERALALARRVDLRRRRGTAPGPLAGVPFVVKDNIDVRRQTTASGSRAHAGVLALRNARVVSRLIEAGAVLLARANMDELAMGASTCTSAFGPTSNPWDPWRSPGGSSGGSAAAVAAGFAALAVGTDTGGSIREPAAQCGVVGLAPSPRLVSRVGVVPFAPGLDRVGPLARTVADIARALAVMSGRVPAAPDGALRVGLVREFTGVPNQAGVLARLDYAVALLAELGVEVLPVSIPDAARGLGAYVDITSAACVPWLEPYVRTGQAGAEVERRWHLGRALLHDRQHELADALAVQRRLTAQARAALHRVDVLLSPTMPTTAPVLDPATAEDLSDPMSPPYTDCWTVVANLARLAALSLPAGRSADDGMPVGMMLCGRPGSDGSLLALAAALEAAGLASPRTTLTPPWS